MDYRGWRHRPSPVGAMGTTTTGLEVEPEAAGMRLHATSLGQGRGRAVFPPKIYQSALGNGSMRRSGSGVAARKTGRGQGINRCYRVVIK